MFSIAMRSSSGAFKRCFTFKRATRSWEVRAMRPRGNFSLTRRGSSGSNQGYVRGIAQNTERNLDTTVKEGSDNTQFALGSDITLEELLDVWSEGL